MSAQRAALLAELGVTATFDYDYVGEGDDRHRVELGIVTGVEPDLSAEQWAAMAMREGDAYVGGCCGNLSMVQDYVNGAFRDSGYFDADSLLTIGQLVTDHDGFDEFDEMDDDTFAARVRKYAESERTLGPDDVMDPWVKLGLVWNAYRTELKPGRESEPKPPLGRHDAEKRAVKTLARTFQYLDWHDFFGGRGRGPDDDKRHEIQRQVLRARALPPLRTLLALLEANQERFDGYAIVTPGTDEPMSNRLGQCLYATREQAEEIVALWKKFHEEEPDAHPVVVAEIVPCSVTVEDGLVIHR